jgi:SAM-dependent methyltransferase
VTGTDASREVAPDDWETHWDDYADCAGRNPAQTFRRRVVLGLMGRGGAPQRYVDIGCGQGDLAADVAKRWPKAEVAGLELSAKGCELASGKVPGGRFVQFDLLSGQDPPEALAGWATHATCSEVLEHVDEPDEFLVAARRWLAPGATLVVTVPGGPMSAFDHHIGHRRHYDIADLTALLEGAGFTVDQCGGAGFPLFNLYRRVVIARGERLVSEVEPDGRTSLPVRAGLAVFSGLLAVSPTGGRRGWQLYATATAPLAPEPPSEQG